MSRWDLRHASLMVRTRPLTADLIVPTSPLGRPVHLDTSPHNRSARLDTPTHSPLARLDTPPYVWKHLPQSTSASDTPPIGRPASVNTPTQPVSSFRHASLCLEASPSVDQLFRHAPYRPTSQYKHAPSQPTSLFDTPISRVNLNGEQVLLPYFFSYKPRPSLSVCLWPRLRFCRTLWRVNGLGSL